MIIPDDIGAVASEPANIRPRARQNVILELGFFVAKLGRARVCTLYKPPTEIPADIMGIVYVSLDDAGAWRYKLVSELRAAGFDVDANRL